MVRERGSQAGVLGVRLGIVPTDFLVVSDDNIAIVKYAAGAEIYKLAHPQFESGGEKYRPFKVGSERAGAVQPQR